MKDCQECIKQQGDGDFDRSITMLRVGDGNLMVIGCALHLAELINRLGARATGKSKSILQQ